MIASLLMLIGMGVIVVSCKKEKQANSGNSLKAEMIAEYGKPKRDTDEDPYIRVRVKKKHSLSPVTNANVETFEYGTNLRISSDYTDSVGETKQIVTPGIYYFQVTPSGTTVSFVTDTIHVNSDVTTTIFID